MYKRTTAVLCAVLCTAIFSAPAYSTDKFITGSSFTESSDKESSFTGSSNKDSRVTGSSDKDSRVADSGRVTENSNDSRAADSSGGKSSRAVRSQYTAEVSPQGYTDADAAVIASLVSDAASGEVYLVRLALAAAAVNRMTVYGQDAAYVCDGFRQTHNFKARKNGSESYTDGDFRAAVMALCGVDPTGGATDFATPRDQVRVPTAAFLLKAEGYVFW